MDSRHRWARETGASGGRAFLHGAGQRGGRSRTGAWRRRRGDCRRGRAAIARFPAERGLGSLAYGWRANAVSDLSIAIDKGAQATSLRGTAVGPSSVASGLHATALGPFATASGMGASALGNGASATQAGSLAAGVLSQATGQNATAIGRQAVASATSSTALGANSSATFASSTAVGTGATTTAANQLALGGTGSHVRIGDIAASTAAQQGSSVGVATVDANGVLGRDVSILPAIASQAGAISALQAETDQLFDLARRNRSDIRDANEGVAMALALDTPNVPAGARVALAGGIGYFKGRTSLATAVSVAVGEMSSVSAGVGYGFNSKEIGARAGFQLAW